MFVLMVAELSPALSEVTSGLTLRAEFGNRSFCCFSHLGERFLFSAVPFEAIEEFRSAVALLAEPSGDGGFIVWAAATIDCEGKLHTEDGSWPMTSPKGSVTFVHFLTETDAEQEELVGDASAPANLPGFSLAA